MGNKAENGSTLTLAGNARIASPTSPNVTGRPSTSATMPEPFCSWRLAPFSDPVESDAAGIVKAGPSTANTGAFDLSACEWAEHGSSVAPNSQTGPKKGHRIRRGMAIHVDRPLQTHVLPRGAHPVRRRNAVADRSHAPAKLD